MAHPILENWYAYDNKKKKYNDANFFSCSESWEVDYLIKKFQDTFSTLSEQQILLAIQNCCRTTNQPHPRKEFVICVAQQLGISI